ncbi:MAG: hypothetical protein IJV16_01455 [Lachnospiraceae bacterium]|nr:hypothetical protein [Lachnospiraceae bacterium]MBR1524853.1 hypothetical protein [Lachnospiraceae bacterium]
MWKYTTGANDGLTSCRDTLGAICGPENSPIVTGDGTFVTYSQVSADQKDAMELYLGKKIWERKVTPLPRFL